MRKRAERERKKLELEALQTPSTSHQTAIARNEITNKFCVRFDSKAKRGKKKDELSDEELKWLKEFLDCPDISYMFPGRKDHVHVGKKEGVKVYEQKRYLSWKLRNLDEIANGGSGIKEASGGFFLMLLVVH